MEHLIHRDLDHRELKKIVGYAIFLALFFAMVLCYLRQSLMFSRLEYKINQNIDLKNRLVKKNTELKLERGFLRSFSRVEKEAKDGLGLTEPQEGQLIVYVYNGLIEGNDFEKEK